MHPDHVVLSRGGSRERLSLVRRNATPLKASPTRFLFALALAGARAAEEPVTLNFVNADIQSVAKTIGQKTQRNFILDPRVKGTVNIVSSRPVPASAALPDVPVRAARAGLRRGRGRRRREDRARGGSQAAPALGRRRARADGDRIVTQVFALQNESASQLVPVLRPLVTANNFIAAYAEQHPRHHRLRGQRAAHRAHHRRRSTGPDRRRAVHLPLQNASAIDIARRCSASCPRRRGGRRRLTRSRPRRPWPPIRAPTA